MKTETDNRVRVYDVPDYALDYSDFLKNAKNTRKKNISVIELCDKLNAQKTTIYRIERAEVDPKLSTLISYLHGFSYHLEMLPDYETIQDEPTVDYTVEINGTNVLIENIDLNKAKTDKRLRMAVIKYLLALMESDLDLDEE